MLQGIDIVDVISEIAASYDPPTGAQHRKTVYHSTVLNTVSAE
jgi:hypothetical protein